MSKKQKAEKPTPRGRAIAAILVIALVAGAAIVLWAMRGSRGGPGPDAASTVAAATATAADAGPILGRWQRPDGGYVLEITAWKPGGKLEVNYFNPRPIHVGQAAWTRTSDGLNAFVELRDTGYPGATYALRFDPARDRLVGSYYQPAAGQTFEVEFARLPAGQ
jgi:hypothetical protein